MDLVLTGGNVLTPFVLETAYNMASRTQCVKVEGRINVRIAGD